MNTVDIYKQIIDSIISSTNNAGEVKIVEKSIDKIKKLSWPSNINVQTGFCHQKPYAMFINPNSLYNKTKTELGDFLFIIKYKDKNEIFDKRALFFQAKYNNSIHNFKIELHQFHFYKQIDKIEFQFGNSVYQNARYKPIIWKNLSKPSDFGDYILLGDDFALDIFIEIISLQYEHKQNGHFNFEINNHPFFPYLYHEYCKYCSPLLNFLTPFGKGNKIEGTFEKFIDIIYKRLGILPDPPKEHAGFWEENHDGFGLIEITIDNKELVD